MFLCGWASSHETSHYEIAFASFAPLNTGIFIADADGNNAKALFADPDLDSNASFSKDGRWIVFTSRRGGSSNIYRRHPDGTALEVLVNDPAYDDQAALSPDCKELAFVSARSGQADIWVLNIRTKSLRNVTNHAGGDFRPAWSPDGKWLSFSSDRDSSRPRMPNDFVTRQSTELYVIKADRGCAGSPINTSLRAVHLGPLTESIWCITARPSRS